MKYLHLVLLGSGCLLLGACSSDRGGTAEDYQTTTGYGRSPAEVSPQPSGSPTFRPGMNPEDPRDPHFTTRPEPMQSPPAAPQ